MLSLLSLLIFIGLIVILPVIVFFSNISFLSKISVNFQYFISILLLIFLIPLEYGWGFISAMLFWPGSSSGYIRDILISLGNYVAFAMLFIISILAYKIFRNAEKDRQFKPGLNLISTLNVVIGIAVIGFYLFWLIVVGLFKVNI